MIKSVCHVDQDAAKVHMKTKENKGGNFCTDLSPLSFNIHMQILLTDFHAFFYDISWEKLLKAQIPITFLDYVLIL